MGLFCLMNYPINNFKSNFILNQFKTFLFRAQFLGSWHLRAHLSLRLFLLLLGFVLFLLSRLKICTSVVRRVPLSCCWHKWTRWDVAWCRSLQHGRIRASRNKWRNQGLSKSNRRVHDKWGLPKTSRRDWKYPMECVYGHISSCLSVHVDLRGSIEIF